MTFDEIRVLDDLVAAAKLMRKGHEAQADAGFLSSLERFSVFAQADDEVLKAWKITRRQHERIIATAFQELKTGSRTMQ